MDWRQDGVPLGPVANRRFKATIFFSEIKQYQTAFVKPQFSRDRAHYPSIESHAPSAIPTLTRRTYTAIHLHYFTSNSQPQAPAALRQKLARTLTRRAARTISSAVRCHQPEVWSKSRSRIGSAPKPAACINGSYVASPSSPAVWSNSKSGIASNSVSGAASSGANSILTCFQFPLHRLDTPQSVREADKDTVLARGGKRAGEARRDERDTHNYGFSGNSTSSALLSSTTLGSSSTAARI